MKNNDIDLIALSQGNVKAFDTLFLLYYPKVKQFINSILNCDEEAEDLTQDTFVKLWKARASLTQVQNINAYIYRIAKNTLYSHLDQKLNVQSIDIENIDHTSSLENIEDLIYSHELESLINQAIAHMPPQRKQVFCMSRKQGLSNDQIATLLGISKRTVETHISAALATLRKITSVLILFFY